MRAAALAIGIIASVAAIVGASLRPGPAGSLVPTLAVVLIGFLSAGLVMRWPIAGGVLLALCVPGIIMATGSPSPLPAGLYIVAALLAFLSRVGGSAAAPTQ